jgi:hypothetical protein
MWRKAGARPSRPWVPASPRAPGSGSSFSMNQAISPSLPRIGDSSMFS